MTPLSRRDLIKAGLVGLGAVAVGEMDLLIGSTPGESSSFTFHHDHILGTSLDICLHAECEVQAMQVEEIILGEIERLRAVFSTYDPASELSRLNATRKPMPVSADLLTVLRLYEHRHKVTGGACNAQIGGLIRLWSEADRTDHLPEPTELSRIVHEIAQPGWSIDESNSTVTRLTEQPLNLNSLAKGYIIQKAAEKVRTTFPTLRSLLINLGGDMTAWGNQDAGLAGWAIGIQNPQQPEENARPLTALMLKEAAVATSGGYQRFYTVAGQPYSHLIDPRTGRPADAIAGATVVARNSATANALATTLCVMMPEEGLQLVARTEGAECLLIDAIGRQIRSAGFSALEVPISADEPEKKDTTKAKQGANDPWAKDYQVSINLEILKPTSGRRARRPYVAVWIEDSAGKAIRTITVWGTQPRWQPTLTGWWKIGGGDRAFVKSVSRATRSPGKYTVVWDGKDDNGKFVSQGTYTVRVEVHREHGKHTFQSGKITCNAEKAEVHLAKNAEAGETVVQYNKKK